MTSTKARSAGLGAVATFAGFAASLGGAAVAHASPTGSAFGTDHETTSCLIDGSDIQYAPAAEDGKTPLEGWQEDGKTPVGGWQSAVGFERIKNEPTHGILLHVKDGTKIGDDCSRTISLASYTAQGKSWDTSGLQGFVGVVSTKLDATHKSASLVVPLPTSTNADSCYGQLDLYFGNIVYDGQVKPGHGPLPSYPKISTPLPDELIAAWNGADSETCSAPSSSSSSPASSSSSSSSAPSSSPSSSSTPSVPTTPSATGSTSILPTATTSSSAGPALAHTGSNAGVISLVALTLFGAGGATVLASRKAAAARKH